MIEAVMDTLRELMPVGAEKLNWVDAAIAAILLAYAFGGLRRGFLAGTADLVGMVLAFAVAVKLYGPTVGWLSTIITLPQILVNFIALVGLFALGQAVFGLIVGPLLGFIHRFLLPGPLGWLNSLAGLAPGLAKGVIAAAALVALFALFPLNPSLAQDIRDSGFGTQLSEGVGWLAPQLEALAGNSPYDTALFVTRPTESKAPRKLSFPSGLALREDAAAEQRMLDLVNAERAKVGVPPVALDPRLRDVARSHSQDMFRRGYFAHDSPEGAGPGDRLRSARIPFLAMGENLAYAPSVEVAHTGLMNSPGHRQNILSPSFGHLGIGVLDGGLYGKMFTQEFTN